MVIKYTDRHKHTYTLKEHIKGIKLIKKRVCVCLNSEWDSEDTFRQRTERGPESNWTAGHGVICLPAWLFKSLPLSLRKPLSPWFLSYSRFPLHVSLCSQSLKQSVSKAVSRFVPVWLKHYLRGFATLFLKRSDILSQPPPLPTGKLKMPQSPQATRFIYLHTYWVRERETEGEDEREGEGDLRPFCEEGCV